MVFGLVFESSCDPTPSIPFVCISLLLLQMSHNMGIKGAQQSKVSGADCWWNRCLTLTIDIFRNSRDRYFSSDSFMLPKGDCSHRDFVSIVRFSFYSFSFYPLILMINFRNLIEENLQACSRLSLIFNGCRVKRSIDYIHTYTCMYSYPIKMVIQLKIHKSINWVVRVFSNLSKSC